jgi:hypothetical protein
MSGEHEEPFSQGAERMSADASEWTIVEISDDAPWGTVRGTVNSFSEAQMYAAYLARTVAPGGQALTLEIYKVKAPSETP